jgi:hypothetical protein
VPGHRQPAASTTPTEPGTSQPTSVPLTMKWKRAGPVCHRFDIHVSTLKVRRYPGTPGRDMDWTSHHTAHTVQCPSVHTSKLLPAKLQKCACVFFASITTVPLRIAERRVPDAVPPTLPRTARGPWEAGWNAHVVAVRPAALHDPVRRPPSSADTTRQDETEEARLELGACWIPASMSGGLRAAGFASRRPQRKRAPCSLVGASRVCSATQIRLRTQP